MDRKTAHWAREVEGLDPREYRLDYRRGAPVQAVASTRAVLRQRSLRGQGYIGRRLGAGDGAQRRGIKLAHGVGAQQEAHRGHLPRTVDGEAKQDRAFGRVGVGQYETQRIAIRIVYARRWG